MRYLLLLTVFAAGCANAPEPGSLLAIKRQWRADTYLECWQALGKAKITTRIKRVYPTDQMICEAVVRQTYSLQQQDRHL